jgi:hypothetical protein
MANTPIKAPVKARVLKSVSISTPKQHPNAAVLALKTDSGTDHYVFTRNNLQKVAELLRDAAEKLPSTPPKPN